MSLHRGGDNSSQRAGSGAHLICDDLDDPATLALVDLDSRYGQPVDTQEQRRLTLPVLTLSMRALNQAVTSPS